MEKVTTANVAEIKYLGTGKIATYVLEKSKETMVNFTMLKKLPRN